MSVENPTEQDSIVQSDVREEIEIKKGESFFSDYESKKIREWSETLVKSWHDDIKPDYIFVTDTRAVPHGYVLKEAWKRAYPNEICPKFYRINPGAPIINNNKKIKFLNSKSHVWEERNFDTQKAGPILDEQILKRITTQNPRIIIFDEGRGRPQGFEAIGQFSNEDEIAASPLDGKDYNEATLDVDSDGIGLNIPFFKEVSAAHTTKLNTSTGKVANALYKTLKEGKFNASIWTSRQAKQDEGEDLPDHAKYGIDYLNQVEKGLTGGLILKKGYSGQFQQSTLKNPRPSEIYHEGLLDEDFVGTVTKNPEERTKALLFIKELKQIGQNAGEELYTQINKVSTNV